MTLSPRVWSDVLRQLQEKIPDFAFEAWIAPLAIRVAEDADEHEEQAHEEQTGKDRARRAPTRRLVVGCPTSFHRDRVRTNYGAMIQDCWRSACEASSTGDADADCGGGGVGADGHARTIEIVTMKEFAAAGGTKIEVRLPDRKEWVEARTQKTAAATRSMRKVGGATALARTMQAQTGQSGIAPGSGHVQPSVGSPSPAPLHAVPGPIPQKSARAASKASELDRRPVARPSDVRPEEPDTLQPELPFSFDSFIVGPCNALAREAALALARRRQQSLNQLYLSGGSGMGKTHLARAAAMEARRIARPRGSEPRPTPSRQRPTPPVVYTSAEQFTSEFVSAMRRGQQEEWKRRYRSPIELLVVEDVQFFSGRAKTQLELFHTVQHVLDAGGRVLLTGDCAPRDLVGLDDRIRHQVGRGFVAELEMPDAMIRRHILRSKAAGGGFQLPTDCLDLLVESTEGSVRDVESMLIQVVTTASLLGRGIDLDLVREAISLKSNSAATPKTRTLACEEIVRIVAAFFGKRPEAITGRSRRRDVLIPRQLAMYLCHRYTAASFTEIGRSLGRDHPSVRNAIGRVERLVLENAPVRYQVEALSERIDQFIKDMNDDA